MGLRDLLANEGWAHGLRTAAVRGVRRYGRRMNGRVLGWSGSSLPLGSTVLGAAHIRVGDGFDAAQPVWLEAITAYGGERFDPEIVIGERFSTSGRLHVSTIDSVRIGDDCLFGSNVYIGDHGHGSYSGERQSTPEGAPRLRPLVSRGPVSIGHRCWLGDNVVVLQGVHIGDGAVIGANSVVTRDVPAGGIAVGSPAVTIRRFDSGSGSWGAVRARQETPGRG
ncbi:acyltransferase [uncultured Amnibacterium sp.]|uniref:acyltransferase n=1 Tax=uncultured Amnibacterium sp. TaxID=1631851 RepID=UPI0035CC6E1E